MIVHWLDTLSGIIPVLLLGTTAIAIITAIVVYYSEIKKCRKAVLILSIVTAVITGVLGYLSHYDHEKGQTREAKMEKEIAEAHKNTSQILKIIVDAVFPLFTFEEFEKNEGLGFVLNNYAKYSPLENIELNFKSLSAGHHRQDILYDKLSIDFKKTYLKPGGRIELPTYLTTALNKSDKHTLAFTTVCKNETFVQIMLLRHVNEQWEAVTRVYKEDSIYYETKDVPNDFLSEDEAEVPYPDIEQIRKLACDFRNRKNRRPLSLTTDSIYKVKTWLSTDKQKRFRIEYFPGANVVKLTERRKRGHELTRQLPILHFSDSCVRIECPNDKKYLQFQQFSGKLIQSILIRKPEKSILTFNWNNKKGKGSWAGLYVINKVKGKLGYLIQPNERKAIPFNFKEI